MRTLEFEKELIMKKDKKDDFVKEIPKKSENISEWYTAVILKGELADYSPVRGCMVIRPYGYAVWENIQNYLNARFKETGHRNGYFPMFIPESFLRKEAEHVEGFAPQVAMVTKGGGEPLTEPLVVRPTSESIICSMYSKWIKSYRDLPVLINQWCNVVRWEKTTRLFLRSMEFLWQEGHTVHRTAAEAEEETERMLEVYREFAENFLALPVLTGRKTEGEKFAGADHTYTIEALMPDGQALQSGTSHNLGQHFAKAFDIKFLDSDNTEKYPFQTSWGISTRIMGAVIMMHGDDRGLAFPPSVAPTQIVIVPIFYGQKELVLDKAYEIKRILDARFRVEIDARDEFKPGWKFNEWEMKGVPLRIEIGPKDIEKGQVTVSSRIGEGKSQIPIDNLEERIEGLLADIQKGFYDRAKSYFDSHIFDAVTIDDIRRHMEEGRKGFYRTMWCGSEECADKIGEETSTTPRCISKTEDGDGVCCCCGREAHRHIYFARAY